jgi:signal transduction histidine kinase
MLKLITVTFLTVVIAIPALADHKFEGDTVLKDSQPAGVANKHDKHMKHQVFDLTFDAAGNEYICRTDSDKSMNPMDFVVGSNIHYQVDGKKVKIMTANNKKVACNLVRVAVAPAAPQ